MIDDIATQDEMLSQAPTATRKRVRWYHVVTLGVAVLVCAAAVGFSVSQSSDRDDVTSTRRRPSTLAAQHAGTQHARDRLAGHRADTKAALEQVATLTTTFHELTDLSNQEIDAMNAAHQIGVADLADIDGYNAQIDRGNALIPLMEAKEEEIGRFVDDLRRDVEAQTAALVR